MSYSKVDIRNGSFKSQKTTYVQAIEKTGVLRRDVDVSWWAMAIGSLPD